MSWVVLFWDEDSSRWERQARGAGELLTGFIYLRKGPFVVRSKQPGQALRT